MKLAIALPASADAWRTVARAEDLGFAEAWFYDTPAVAADPFVAMGAAAVTTRTIRLGTGVAVPSNRPVLTMANGLASLAKLAPKRIDFGVGSGFSSRRALGLGPMRLADVEEYVRAVELVVSGDEAAISIEGEVRPVRFLNPERGLINLFDPIPSFISAYGQRGRSLAADLGAGWIMFAGDAPRATNALEDMKSAWNQTGRAPGNLRSCLFAMGCVLREGESAASDRALAQAGPGAALILHRAADAEFRQIATTTPVHSELAATVAAYLEQARRSREDGRTFQENHRGHAVFVRHDERPFITNAMMRLTTFTASAETLRDTLVGLRDVGYGQFVIQVTPGSEDSLDDWANLAERDDDGLLGV